MVKEATAFFSLNKGKNYYTSSARKVLDFLIGLIFGFMFIGISFWHYPEYLWIFVIVILAIVIGKFYVGRKWIGLGVLIGAIAEYLFTLVA